MNSLAYLLTIWCILGPVLSAGGIAVVPECGKPFNVTASAVDFVLSKSGATYAAKISCNMLLTAGEGKKVSLTITTLETKKTADACLDPLVLIDGPDPTSNRLFVSCAATSKTIISSGNQLLLLFYSGPTPEGAGFTISFKQLDDGTPTKTEEPTIPPKLKNNGGRLNEARGTLTVPSPSDGELYVWTLEAKEGHIVKLNITEQPTEYQTIQIYDGQNTFDELLASDFTKSEFNSTTRYMTVLYAGTFGNTKKFEAKYDNSGKFLRVEKMFVLLMAFKVILTSFF